MQPAEVVNVGAVIIVKGAVAIVTKVIINVEVAAVAAINVIH
ncbi:hypothetical protein [Psychrobacillus antarcticus]|nr:hypothetical protein [Psychrobacillus antarcticus]